MKSWYKVTKDITLKDGSTIKEDRLTFETTDKDISKRVETFFKSLMDTADTPQTETQIETQNKDGSGENMLLSALCKGFSIQDIIKDEPKYKDCNSCRYEDGDERCIPCSEGYSFYWKPKDEPQTERSE